MNDRLPDTSCTFEGRFIFRETNELSYSRLHLIDNATLSHQVEHNRVPLREINPRLEKSLQVSIASRRGACTISTNYTTLTVQRHYCKNL